VTVTELPPAPSLVPGDLRELLGVPFTDEQLTAVSAPLEPAVIIAGAGSGKTSVMAARVVWLVATGQVAPERVLGLTFTTKAAAELAGRVRKALDTLGPEVRGPHGRGRLVPGQAGPAPRRADAGDTDVGDDPGEPVVSTYHAFAGRLVTEHALRLGLEPRARLLADATRYQLAARVLRAHRGPVEALTAGLSGVAGDLVALEAEMSEHLVEPADLVAFEAAREREIAAALDALRGEPRAKTLVKELRNQAAKARARRELAGLAAAYRAAKRDLDALDFGDQVTFAARLAESVPAVGAAERERAGVVLLDEYQDTSVAQRRMLSGLFGGGHPVTAVGDPCQAIYGWRGASVANLDAFPEHFAQAGGGPSAVYQLTVNQRSGGRLLALANEVAAGLRRRHRVAELRPRPAVADAGHTVVALHATWADEARWVAASLRGVVESGVAPPGGCAVLVRARADVPGMYAALLAQGLPVEVVGLGGLLSLPEVSDVIATLEVLDDPTANAALTRLLTGPRVRLGVRDLAALGRRAAEAVREPSGGSRAAGLETAAGPAATVADEALAEAVAGVDPCDVIALSDVLGDPGPAVSAEGRRRLRALDAELGLLRAGIGEPLGDLVHRIVEVTGLEVELAASPDAVASRRRETLAAFIDVVAGFTDLDNENSLPAFLAFLRAAQEHERGLDAATPAGSDSVQLMTVHKSKGLEWEVVAVPNLTRGVFPITTLRSRWTTTSSVLPTPLRGDARDLPALGGLDKAALGAFGQDCRDHLEREERRLGYVAFTRAKSLLLGSGHWWGPTQKAPRGPSVFLHELRDHAMGGHGEVAVWTPEPAGSVNPDLVAAEELTWPSPYEPAAFARRVAAAGAVRAHLAQLAAGEPLPADELAGMTRLERAQLAELDRDAALLLAEARLARRPVREVALPRSLTASQVVRVRADPGGFARELARPMPRRPVPQARRGTRFHAWVEQLFGHRPLLDPDELPGAADGEAGDDDLASLKDAFLAGPFASRVPLALEAPFEVMIGPRAVRGRIDAVYALGGGRFDVVDWKTGREPADGVQLAVYRLAWARLRGVEPAAVDACFFYVRTGEIARPPLLDEERLVELLTAGPG
jgi:DNA helicase II / ATP-dependent DNA helicase PcrA